MGCQADETRGMFVRRPRCNRLSHLRGPGFSSRHPHIDAPGLSRIECESYKRDRSEHLIQVVPVSPSAINGGARRS